MNQNMYSPEKVDNNMDSPVYQVLIVGGGPIGLACGIEATKRHLDYLIIEKGCLVNSIYHYPSNMTFFSTSQKIEMGDVPFVSHQPKPTRLEALEYYRRVKEQWKLKVNTYEEVYDIKREGLLYRVESSKGQYLAHAVVIATGFYDHPNLMNVPGEDLAKVKHYYNEPHPYIDQKVIVVGAANSAVDAAMEIWRKGAEVTMVVRKGEISPRVKYWIKPDVENRIKEGSIKAYFNTTIGAIHAGSVDLNTPEGLVNIPNDFVLALTGYQPDFTWLRKLGIELTDDEQMLPIVDEHTFETNLPNVYMSGTVCGGRKTSKWFIENSIEHASSVMTDITGKLQLIA